MHGKCKAAERTAHRARAAQSAAEWEQCWQRDIDDDTVLRCALIDFAHCFYGEQGQDANFLTGLEAMSGALRTAREALHST